MSFMLVDFMVLRNEMKGTTRINVASLNEKLHSSEGERDSEKGEHEINTQMLLRGLMLVSPACSLERDKLSKIGNRY